MTYCFRSSICVCPLTECVDRCRYNLQTMRHKQGPETAQAKKSCAVRGLEGRLQVLHVHVAAQGTRPGPRPWVARLPSSRKMSALT